MAAAVGDPGAVTDTVGDGDAGAVVGVGAGVVAGAVEGVGDGLACVGEADGEAAGVVALPWAGPTRFGVVTG
jgi:hypothetical protein